MQNLSRFGFFRAYIWADLKHSWWWKVLTASYALLGAIALALWVVTPWTPGQIFAPWFGKAKIILVLGIVCVGLAILVFMIVDGARRVYLEKVAELEADHAKKEAKLTAKIESLLSGRTQFELNLAEVHRQELREAKRERESVETKYRFLMPHIKQEGEVAKRQLATCRAEAAQLKAQVEPLKAELRKANNRWAEHIRSKEPEAD